MIYGYARISSGLQDTDKQRYEILKFAFNKGIKLDELIYETVSGRVSYKKRKLGGLINRLEIGDTLIITELSRLGRSLLEIMELLLMSDLTMRV